MTNIVYVTNTNNAQRISVSNETAAIAYEGTYDVRPETVPQTLETSGRRMQQDVAIQAIPYYQVSNNFNGDTVIIGGM